MGKTTGDTHARGYEHAVKLLFDGVIKSAETDAKRNKEIARRTRRINEGFGYDPGAAYASVLEELELLPDDVYFSRSLATFYLQLTANTLRAALKTTANTHPFRPPESGGATKGEVKEWFRLWLEKRENKTIPKQKGPLLRDFDSKIPFLISDKGRIVAAGIITGIDPVLFADAVRAAMTVQWMTLGEALKKPWLSAQEREPWAKGYLRLLLNEQSRLDAAMRHVDAEIHSAKKADLAAGDGPILAAKAEQGIEMKPANIYRN